jgi:hypothetical protein
MEANPMSSETGNHPPNTRGTNDEKTTENRGGATQGPVGAIRRTRNTAPDPAGPDLIQAVALRAYSTDIDPAEISAAIQRTPAWQAEHNGGDAT